MAADAALRESVADEAWDASVNVLAWEAPVPVSMPSMPMPPARELKAEGDDGEDAGEGTGGERVPFPSMPGGGPAGGVPWSSSALPTSTLGSTASIIKQSAIEYQFLNPSREGPGPSSLYRCALTRSSGSSGSREHGQREKLLNVIAGLFQIQLPTRVCALLF